MHIYAVSDSSTIRVMTADISCDDSRHPSLLCICLGRLLCDMVVICEHNQMSTTLLLLAEVGIKLINTEWIVQYLIQGKKLDSYEDFWFSSK